MIFFLLLLAVRGQRCICCAEDRAPCEHPESCPMPPCPEWHAFPWYNGTGTYHYYGPEDIRHEPESEDE